MNRPKPRMIEIREKRSLALHRAIVTKLSKNPELWKVPFANIDRWNRQAGYPTRALWIEILNTMSKEDILKLLVSRSERAISLRKSSPFVGIIDQETRERIFRKYAQGAF